MRHVVILKSRIREFLDKLRSSYRVAAPVMDGGVPVFKVIESAAQVLLTDELPYKSPKEFFFPQVERFLHFDENGEVSAETQAEKMVIFGVRPCDLQAIKVLTAVFTKDKFVDTLFVNHRKNTLMIGLECLNEKPGCFCGERGVDRKNSGDCDVFLTDMGDYYLADVLTEGGESIVKDFPDHMDDDAAGAGAPELLKAAPGEATVPGEAADGDKRILELNADENTLFHKIDWDRISETCIGCGTCTYICPTCHCFAFKDVAENRTASRYRCWDSCMYPKFTLHASGHNPRPSKKERYRQRILHKYLYIRQNFGYTACTGCGRCIRSCPAGMNIKSVVKRIMEELT